METRELSIGNLIDLNGNIFDIELRDLIRIDRIPEDYKPIPLTEQWLLKLGLVYMDGWDDQIYYCCPKNQEFQIMLCNDGYEYDYTILKYVHQLQNLYYALTSEELTLQECLN